MHLGARAQTAAADGELELAAFSGFGGGPAASNPAQTKARRGKGASPDKGARTDRTARTVSTISDNGPMDARHPANTFPRTAQPHSGEARVEHSDALKVVAEPGPLEIQQSQPNTSCRAAQPQDGEARFEHSDALKVVTEPARLEIQQSRSNTPSRAEQPQGGNTTSSSTGGQEPIDESRGGHEPSFAIP
ncbi:hypothetical protein OC844_006166, partial [Tilletia horrida]